MTCRKPGQTALVMLIIIIAFNSWFDVLYLNFLLLARSGRKAFGNIALQNGHEFTCTYTVCASRKHCYIHLSTLFPFAFLSSSNYKAVTKCTKRQVSLKVLKQTKSYNKVWMVTRISKFGYILHVFAFVGVGTCMCVCLVEII